MADEEESLDGAQEIGGVVVTIAVDDAALKAAPGTVAEIRKEIEATPATLELTANAEPLRAVMSESHEAMIAELQEMSAKAAATELKPTLQITGADEAMSVIADLRKQAAAQEINVRAMIEGEARAVESPFDKDFREQRESRSSAIDAQNLSANNPQLRATDSAEFFPVGQSVVPTEVRPVEAPVAPRRQAATSDQPKTAGSDSLEPEDSAGSTQRRTSGLAPAHQFEQDFREQRARQVAVEAAQLTAARSPEIIIPEEAGAIASFAQAGHGSPGFSSARSKIPTGFSKAAVERKLLAAYEQTGAGFTADDERKLQEAAGAGDPFTFHKSLPTEIKEFIQGRPALRKLFRVSSAAGRGGGSDAFGELGDEYLSIAERVAGSPVRAAVAAAKTSDDPELNQLADYYENLPKSSAGQRARATRLRNKAAGPLQDIPAADGKPAVSADQQRQDILQRADALEARANDSVVRMESVAADQLATGDTFTIAGRTHTITEPEENERHLTNESGLDVPLAGLTSLPVDIGSRRKAADVDAGAVSFGEEEKPAATKSPRLYHVTFPENEDSIRGNGFRASENGELGPGVYLTKSPESVTGPKYSGKETTAIPVESSAKILQVPDSLEQPKAFFRALYGNELGDKKLSAIGDEKYDKFGRPNWPMFQDLAKEEGYGGFELTDSGQQKNTVVFNPKDVTPLGVFQPFSADNANVLRGNFKSAPLGIPSVMPHAPLPADGDGDPLEFSVDMGADKSGPPTDTRRFTKDRAGNNDAYYDQQAEERAAAAGTVATGVPVTQAPAEPIAITPKVDGAAAAEQMAAVVDGLKQQASTAEVAVSPEVVAAGPAGGSAVPAAAPAVATQPAFTSSSPILPIRSGITNYGTRHGPRLESGGFVSDTEKDTVAVRRAAERKAAVAERAGRVYASWVLEKRLAEAKSPVEQLQVLRDEVQKHDEGSLQRVRLETRAAKLQTRIAAGGGDNGGDGGDGGGTGGGTPNKRRSRLSSMAGLTRHLGGGILAYEGINLIAESQRIGEERVLAGNDMARQLQADKEQAQSVESIPILGKGLGVILEDITGSKLQTAATEQQTAAQEASNQSIVGQHESLAEDRRQHAQLVAPGDYNREMVAAENRFESKEIEARDKRNLATGDARKILNANLSSAAALGHVDYWYNSDTSIHFSDGDDRSAKQIAAEKAANSTFDIATQKADKEYHDQLAIAASGRDYSNSLTAEDKSIALSNLDVQIRATGLEQHAKNLEYNGDPVGAVQSSRDAEGATLLRSLQAAIQKERDPQLSAQMTTEAMVRMTAFNTDTDHQVMVARAHEAANVRIISSETGAMVGESQATQYSANHDATSAYTTDRESQRQLEQRKLEEQINDKQNPPSIAVRQQLEKRLTTQFGAVDVTGERRGGTFQADTDAGLKRMREQQEAESTLLYARAAADRLQIQHQTFDAEMVLLRAEGAAKLKAADVSQKAAISAANIAAEQRAVAERGLQLTNEASGAHSAQRQSKYLQARDTDKASLEGYDEDTRQELSGLNGSDLIFARAKRAAGRQAMVAGQQFEHKITSEDLGSRIVAANQTIAGRDQEASLTPRIRSLVREVELASPEDRAKTKAATSAELSALGSEMTGFHGGTIVQGSTDNGAVQAEIFAARARAADQEGALKELAAGQQQIAGWNGPPVLPPDLTPPPPPDDPGGGGNGGGNGGGGGGNGGSGGNGGPGGGPGGLRSAAVGVVEGWLGYGAKPVHQSKSQIAEHRRYRELAMRRGPQAVAAYDKNYAAHHSGDISLDDHVAVGDTSRLVSHDNRVAVSKTYSGGMLGGDGVMPSGVGGGDQLSSMVAQIVQQLESLCRNRDGGPGFLPH